MILKIDVTDWKEEAEQAAIKLTSQDDVITAMQETNLKPMAAGRQLIVNRELGKAQADVLPANKVCLQIGAALAVSRRIERVRADVTINGDTQSVRRYVGTVTTDETGLTEYNSEMPSIFDDSNSTLVEYSDPIAQERAIQYLMTNVMGRIDERLKLIAAGKGDVRKVADTLKGEIDHIAEKYC